MRPRYLLPLLLAPSILGCGGQPIDPGPDPFADEMQCWLTPQGSSTGQPISATAVEHDLSPNAWTFSGTFGSGAYPVVRLRLTAPQVGVAYTTQSGVFAALYASGPTANETFIADDAHGAGTFLINRHADGELQGLFTFSGVNGAGTIVTCSTGLLHLNV